MYDANQLLSVASQDVTSTQTVDPNQIDFRTSFYAAVGNTPAIARAARRTRSSRRSRIDQVQSDINVTATDTTGILQVSTTGRSLDRSGADRERRLVRTRTTS